MSGSIPGRAQRNCIMSWSDIIAIKLFVYLYRVRRWRPSTPLSEIQQYEFVTWRSPDLSVSFTVPSHSEHPDWAADATAGALVVEAYHDLPGGALLTISATIQAQAE